MVCYWKVIYGILQNKYIFDYGCTCIGTYLYTKHIYATEHGSREYAAVSLRSYRIVLKLRFHIYIINLIIFRNTIFSEYARAILLFYLYDLQWNNISKTYMDGWRGIHIVHYATKYWFLPVLFMFARVMCSFARLRGGRKWRLLNVQRHSWKSVWIECMCRCIANVYICVYMHIIVLSAVLSSAHMCGWNA